MQPESKETGHGKGNGTLRNVYEAVLHQGEMPGISGRTAVEVRVRLSQMRPPSGVPASNGRYQCAKYRHQASVTAGTVLHKTHLPLTQWYLAFYFVCQDKRGISAVQLASQIGTSYKTARYMLKRIRTAMGQQDSVHQLSGIIEFDDAYFGSPTVGKNKKRGRGTKKTRGFVALSLNERGNPRFLKMRVTQDITQAQGNSI